MMRSKGTREFRAGGEGRVFWDGQNPGGNFTWNDARADPLPSGKRSMSTIAMRLPENLLEGIKIEAEKRGISYQLLIRVWLEEALEQSRDL